MDHLKSYYEGTLLFNVIYEQASQEDIYMGEIM